MKIQRHTLANCLRTAAEQFDRDAAVMLPRMADQFRRQAAEARTLADGIEQTDSIQLED